MYKTSPINTCPQEGGHTGAGGLTLAELLISVAIMGIGLVMAGALFPVGIKETERASNNTLGEIICRNGLSIAGSRYSQGNITTSSLEMPNNYKGSYPKDSNDDTFGYVLLARRVNATKNDYQFVVVSYRKSPDQGVVDFTPKTITSAGGKTLGFDSVAGLAGSPVIIRSGKYAGSYAMIKSVEDDTNNAYLDRPLNGVANGSEVWVVTEAGAPISPAMAVLVGRTALR